MGLGRDIYCDLIAIGCNLTLVTYCVYLLIDPHIHYGHRTLCPTNGHSAVPGAEVGCLWFCSVLIGGCSMGIMETPMGTRCSRVLRLLVRYNSSNTSPW